MPTEPSTERDRVFRFGPFELSEREGELRKSGVRTKLQEQPFRVLIELVANSGKLVSREDLRKKLWPADTFVDFDVGLNSAIRKLRQALNDDADSPRYIETLARRGYRFVATVTEASAIHSAVEKRTGDTPPAEVDSPEVSSTPVYGGEGASDTRFRKAPWLSAVAAAVFLFLAGAAFLAWRGKHSAPSLVTEQKITANPREAPILAAVISPDGKFVAYSDSTGMYLRHIDSGETRSLELPKSFEAVPTSWFPDSTHLMLMALDSSQDSVGLWKVSILGGPPQKLLDQASGGSVSPDGSRIAFLRPDGQMLGIWLARSDGSEARQLVSAVRASLVALRDWRELFARLSFGSQLAWAPDGNRIAFVRSFQGDYRESEQYAKFTLETVAANGGTSTTVMESNELQRALAWGPDGRLFFAELERGKNALDNVGVGYFRVDEKSGKPIGNPKVLTIGGGGIGGLSISANGKRLLLWRANMQPQVFLTGLDAKGERFIPPRRLTLDENENIASAWTADGRSVLLSSNRNGTRKFFRQAIDQVTPELLMEQEVTLRWMAARMGADGSHVFYLGNDTAGKDGVRALFSLPLTGGVPEVLVRMEDLDNQQCSRGSTPVCVLSTQAKDRSSKLYTFNPVKRTTREFLSFPAVKENLNWSLSPDGTTLALMFTRTDPKIRFMNLKDGSLHEVELPGWASVNNADWTTDGKSVLAIAERPSGTASVVEVEPSGRYDVRLEGDKNVRFMWAIQSPDGKHVLLEQMTGENNVWMVENF